MMLTFFKYHGLGNDFIMIDCVSNAPIFLTKFEIQHLCDRHFGVGADGVIIASSSSEGDEADCVMKIYNADGTEPELCGNGLRCFCLFVKDKIDKIKTSQVLKVATGAGLMNVHVNSPESITVIMQQPKLHFRDIPTLLPPNQTDSVVMSTVFVANQSLQVTCVNMGNPHAIVFVENLELFQFSLIGPALECHADFPCRVNAGFGEVISRSMLKLRVWERGCGPTLACGSGACAAVVAGVLAGMLDRTVTVLLPGGSLYIEWNETSNRVIMTGPATFVYQGSLCLQPT